MTQVEPLWIKYSIILTINKTFEKTLKRFVIFIESRFNMKKNFLKENKKSAWYV